MKSILRRLTTAFSLLLAVPFGFAAGSAHAAKTPPAPRAVPGELVVRVPAGMIDSQVQELVAGANCTIIHPVKYMPGFYVVHINGATSYVNTKRITNAAYPNELMLSTATKLRQTAGVAADPNWIVNPSALAADSTVVGITPNDPLYTNQQWHYEAINLPQAWRIQFGSKKVLVGIVDSGIDATHPDFKTPDGTGSRIVAAENFALDDAQTVVVPTFNVDRIGHGTHVAGTVAATSNNNTPTGVAGIAGWNRNGVDVELIAARVFGVDDKGNALGASEDVIASAIAYSVQQGAGVINLSLGFTVPKIAGFVDTIQRAAIQNAVASGVVVVAAAGNDGVSGANFDSFPADDPGVIKVSAINRNRTLTSYSNYAGPVAIAAPGGEGIEGGPDAVWSTWPLAGGVDGQGINGYYSINGTSMACPHVAGVCALMLACGAPQDPAVIRAAIQRTAQTLDEVPNVDGGNKYGAGLIDAYAAVALFADPDPFISVTGGLDGGTVFTRSRQISVDITGANKLATQPTGALVQVFTATEPTTLLHQYVGGTDFDIPTIPNGQPAATSVTATVPRQPFSLADGRYKIVTTITYNNVTNVTSTQFFDVVSHRQSAGRAMFAIPYTVLSENSQNPELAVFGLEKSFRLIRYDPLNPVGGTNPGYFTFSSTGTPAETKGSFRTTTTDAGLPLSFDTSNASQSLAPVGLGYWLDLDQPSTLNVVGNLVPNTSVGIRLYATNGGWNMIGAPFTGSVAWGAVTVSVGNNNYTLEEAINQGIISSILVGYANGDYSYSVAPLGSLDPYNGYWVRVFQDCTLIVPPNFTSGVLGRSAATTGVVAKPGVPMNNGWRARLIATVGGDHDGQNYFGQSSVSSDSADKTDLPKPPSGAGHAYLRFMNTTANGRAASYAYDMRSLKDSAAGVRQKWTAAVSTDKTNAEVTLAWDGLGSAPRRSRFTLKDLQTGRSVALRSRSSYTFRSGEAGSTRQFEITMEPQASAGPLALTNVTTTGGRGVNGLTVRFTATQEADIVGSIKTLSGKSVATLGGATRAVGASETTLHWDGRARDGSAVPVGPYLIEIRARGADGQIATVTRPIQYLR